MFEVKMIIKIEQEKEWSSRCLDYRVFGTQQPYIDRTIIQLFLLHKRRKQRKIKKLEHEYTIRLLSTNQDGQSLIHIWAFLDLSERKEEKRFSIKNEEIIITLMLEKKMNLRTIGKPAKWSSRDSRTMEFGTQQTYIHKALS